MLPEVCERLFLTVNLATADPVLHDDDETSFHGLIRPHADACWISIPDHFEAAWKPVTELHHDQSVADVLFCTREGGPCLRSRLVLLSAQIDVHEARQLMLLCYSLLAACSGTSPQTATVIFV